MVYLLSFVSGLVFLILGSKGIIHNASVLAKKLNLSSLIVGIIFVGIGTSLPELFVTLFSGLDQAGDLGLGNIIGSNITNISLIFGLAVLSNTVYIGTVKTQKNSLVSLSLVLFFSVLLFTETFSFLPGLLLLFLGFLSIGWEIIQGKKGALNEDKKEIMDLPLVNISFPLIGLSFFLSLISLVLGSKLVVDSGIEMAKMLGISSFIIGATVIALGTSLPELSVTIAGSLAKEKKIVVGNILGSNIYNILLCGGLLGLFNIHGSLNLLPLLFFISVSALFSLLILFYRGKVIPRFFGFVLLTFYFLYLAQYLLFDKGN